MAFLIITFTLGGEYQVGGLFNKIMFKGTGECFMVHTSGQCVPITNVNSYYYVLQRSIFPAIYSTQWYNKQPFQETKEVLAEIGWTIDGTHRMLGIPRLRQIRIKQKQCKGSSVLKDFPVYCSAVYTPSREDTDEYGAQWKGATWDDIMANNTIWNYVHPKHSSSTSVFAGSGQEFHGGGYMVELAITRSVSSNILWDLMDAGWLDMKTRVVFFEVSTYNANQNVFTAINFMVEHMETGNVITHTRIWTVFMKDYYSVFNIIYFFNILLDLIKLLMIMNTIGVRTFIRSFWTVYDCIVIIIGFIHIVIYIVFSQILTAYIDDFQHSGQYNYFQVQKLIFRLRIRRYFMGFMFCLTIIRLLRLLFFGIRIISDSQKYSLYMDWPHTIGLMCIFYIFSHLLQRPISYLINSLYTSGNTHFVLFNSDFTRLLRALSSSDKKQLIFLSCYFTYMLSFSCIAVIFKTTILFSLKQSSK